MKVAKRVSDSAHLSLAVRALANEYVSVRVDRVGAEKFQLKAWSKAKEVTSKVTLSSNSSTMTPNTPFVLSGYVYNYSGKGIPGKEVFILDNSSVRLGSAITDSRGGYSFVAKIAKHGEHTLVAVSSIISSREIRISILPAPHYEMKQARIARMKRNTKP
jgi:hypothetical protein